MKSRAKQAISKEQRRTWIIIVLFALCLIGFLFLLFSFPKFTAEEKTSLLRWPRTAKDLHEIYLVISHYIHSRYFTFICAFCYLYIFLQAFAIPGPIFLSVISGALFGGYLGFVLVCMCATLGASLCYLISAVIGRDLVVKMFPGLIAKMNERIEDNKENLIYYMLFLRISPLLPNWFINVSAPIVGIPYLYFLFATLFGIFT
eukprot:TRINITY_DN4879_c0_g1_i2.p2 TRINITY_DN4879_c0_g1~~TRINITY_DN4879_c0_g1_i2.p2  ORF type:complete len:203 (+),score=12.77 TRINITY_DN4879_c0_g1_i2:148-756(+)